MKKVKTILASLMIIMATAIMSACSCSGGGNDDPGVQIPVTAIYITSDFENATRDDETGYLSIRASRNQEFNITYTLKPDNTTRTQVDWDFEGDDSVVVTKRNYSSYSQGSTHTITFVARNVGSTVIKFKPKNTEMWTQATVIVGEAPSVWPEFVAPDGLNYNPTTGKVTWNQVSKIRLYTGEEVNVTMSNGIISGLTGYLVSYRNLETGEEYSTPKNEPIGVCEYELPRGNSYQVSVVARGDDFTTKDSSPSTIFKFHQLATATELKNNNGEISFVSPKYSATNEVYYNSNDLTKFVTRSSNGSETCRFIAGENFDKNQLEYNVSVISYPAGYTQALAEGKNYALEESTGIRYYASLKTDTLTIQNLIAPTISISARREITTVAGIPFGKENSDNNPYLSSVLSWGLDNKSYSDIYGVQFAYAIYKNTSGSDWTKIIPSEKEYSVGTSFDLSDLNGAEGNYRLVVYTFGNATNTIASSTSSMTFSVLGAMDSAVIDNTTLTTSTAYTNVYGVELYFVALDDANNSLYKFVSGRRDSTGNYDQRQLSLNIASLNLKPGRYDVYGKFVGINEGTNNLSATYKTPVKVNNSPIVVASPVNNNSITLSNSGILTFGKVQTIDNYLLKFTRTSGNVSSSFEREISTVDYTQNVVDGVTMCSLDVYGIIKENLRNNGTGDDQLDNELNNYTQNATITITITSVGIDNFGVNSGESSAIKFARHNVVDPSTIELNNYTLLFTSPNGSCVYKIEINGKIIETVQYDLNEKVTIDLNSAIILNPANESERNTPIANYVSANTPTLITVWAVGSTTRADNNTGYIDSFSTSKSFDCTVVPTDLEMTADGDLKWNVVGFETAQSFTFRFYVKENNQWVYATSDLLNNGMFTVNGIERIVDTITGGEDEESETVTGKYLYNVKDIITSIGANKTIAVSVQHLMSDRFTNDESAKYFVAQLSSVNIEYTLSNTHPAIVFTTLDSGDLDYTYTLTITSNLSEEKNIFSYNDLAKSTNITKLLSELGIENIGNYSISIVASRQTTNTNSESNPFIISSPENTLAVNVISRQIEVRADGENVSWNGITENATYTLEYKSSTGDYSYVMEGTSPKIFGANELQYNVWKMLTAGENYIRVTPIIDYTNSGYVLANDELKDNLITKLKGVEEITTSEGKLTYTLNDTFENTDVYDVVVYTEKDGTFTVLPHDRYSIDKTSNTISITSIDMVGANNYALQILSSGKISSDISNTYTATKLSSIVDLTKTGNWINWTHAENIDIYELNIVSPSGETQSIILQKNSSNEWAFPVVNGDDTILTVNTEIFKLLDTKLMFNITGLLGDTLASGDYNYTITPRTMTLGYLNGNISTVQTFTKLSNDITIGVEDESVKLSLYNANKNPDKIEYTITSTKSYEMSFTKGESWGNITFEHNPNVIDNYLITFANENGEEIDSIEIKFIENTAKLKVVSQTEDGEVISYETSPNLTTSFVDNKYTITYLSSAINENSASATLVYIGAGDSLSGSIDYTEEIQNSLSADGLGYLINLNTLGLIDSSDYTITLKFVGNENELVSSDTITNENPISKLNKSNLYTVDGQIAWSEVNGATSYTLKIETDSESSNDTEGDEIVASSTSWTFANIMATTITEEELKAMDETFAFDTGKVYKLTIVSNSADKLSSTPSAMFEVKKLLSPNNIQIVSTGNSITYTDADGNTNTINIGDPMVTWGDPNSLDNYRLNYMLKVGTVETKVYNSTSSTSVLLGQLLSSNMPVGDYEISMRVIGNSTLGTNKMGLITSDYSVDANPVAHYVSETTQVGFGVSTENDQKYTHFDWNAVSGAYAYKLTFYKGMFNSSDKLNASTKVYTTYTTTNSYNFKNTEFTGSGYFTVVVNAITNPTVAIVSTYVDSEEENPVITLNNSTSIYKSTSITKLMVKDGLLSWSLNISDIKEFLNVHTTDDKTKDNDKLLEVFGIEGGDQTTKQKVLLTKTIDYISNRINDPSKSDADIDKIISNLINFNAIINGIETTIAPDVCDVIKMGGTSESPEYNVTSDYWNADYLMFKYDLPTEPVDENGETTTKFEIRIAPQGNNTSSTDNGLISSVDGKFVDKITVYKPKTPTAINLSSETEDRKQIADGKLFWQLVTTEDSTVDAFDYHKNYEITAVNQNNVETKVNREINIDKTIVDGVNQNIVDNINYYKYLKDDDMFKSGVTTNTNYKLYIRVLGTKDSSLLASGEKAYLNSNTFGYTDIMNILENHDTYVNNGEYSYTPCSSMSTQTKVVVYGPFVDDDGNPIYAPDRVDKSTWVWNNRISGKTQNIDYSNDESKTYNDAVNTWKTLIKDIWQKDILGSSKQNNIRNEYTFAEEVEGSGENVRTSRTTTLNLTNKNIPERTELYPAGSYIIRKQEIGNGRGIIDTEFTENLFTADDEIVFDGYEQIATKLSTTTTSAKTLTGDDIWVKDGMFVWSAVPYANAYKIYLEKVSESTGEIEGNYSQVVRTTYFEMPEQTLFNVNGYKYRITITATRLEDDDRTISAGYFEGEKVMSLEYGRAPIPTDLRIDENGIVWWNDTSSSGSVTGYGLRINANNEGESVINYADTKDKNYDLSSINYGTFDFGIRALGKEGFLNSCYTSSVTITKLPNPDIKIINGELIWGTESSAIIGEQPTKTIFTINGNSDLLDYKLGTYDLYSTINSYDSDYTLANDLILYPQGEYTFKVKYQGTSGDVTSSNRTFTIASGEKSVTAIKLDSPVLKSVDILSDNSSENRIRWQRVDNASSYRAIVVTQILDGDQLVDKVFDTSLVENADDYFAFDNTNGTVDLRISKIIEDLRLGENGEAISLNVYVQAVGTLSYIQSENTLSKLYLSGSFSDKKTVEIPSTPTNVTFDGTTGTLNWVVDENKGHNVLVLMNYQVDNVSVEDFNNYWCKTSDSYIQRDVNDNNVGTATINNNVTGRYSEIRKRTFRYIVNTSEDEAQTYTIFASDEVFITSKNGKTPTSYQVTNIGNNYSFSVIVMVSEGNLESTYKSQPATLAGTADNPINFALFTRGDGSLALPYGVDNATRLNSIRYYLDRHFELEQNISFKEGNVITPWEMMDTFTGTIDGCGYTVDSVVPQEIVEADTVTGEIQIYKAIMKENKGTIKNLTITTTNTLSGNVPNSKVMLAGLVIVNNGTIENVNIQSMLDGAIGVNYRNTIDNTYVSGIAIENNGTISNTSVKVGSTLKSGLYALDSNTDIASKKSTYVAGIVNINTGYINGASFEGYIEGNFVSGIASISSGEITQSFAVGIAYVTDAGLDDNMGGKGIQFGGIAGSVYGNATIEDCYSRLEITVEIKSTTSTTISAGGIVGQITNVSDVTNNITIKNTYVVFKGIKIGNTGSLNTLAVYVLAPYSSSATYENNYYLVETIADMDNLEPSNNENVATIRTDLQSLNNTMCSLKKDGQNIYTITYITLDGNETSKYPLLVSNPESDPQKA